MRHALHQLLAGIIVLSPVTAAAHDEIVKVLVKGKIIEKKVDFSGWKGGKDGKEDCCDNRHCRAAVSYRQLPDGSWEFTVPASPGLKNPQLQKVVVPDEAVTKDKPEVIDMGIAFWCGDFYPDYEKPGVFTYNNRCAFKPKEGS